MMERKQRTARAEAEDGGRAHLLVSLHPSHNQIATCHQVTTCLGDAWSISLPWHKWIILQSKMRSDMQKPTSYKLRLFVSSSFISSSFLCDITTTVLPDDDTATDAF